MTTPARGAADRRRPRRRRDPGGDAGTVILRWAWGLDAKKIETIADAHEGRNGSRQRRLVHRARRGKGRQGEQVQFLAARGSRTQQGATNPYVGAPGRDNGRGSWQDFDNMIGGFFKYHWYDPQRITVKIDDPKSPLTAMFKGQEFDVNDEIYTTAWTPGRARTCAC